MKGNNHSIADEWQCRTPGTDIDEASHAVVVIVRYGRVHEMVCDTTMSVQHSTENFRRLFYVRRMCTACIALCHCWA
jgi:hypothetical protein